MPPVLAVIMPRVTARRPRRVAAPLHSLVGHAAARGRAVVDTLEQADLSAVQRPLPVHLAAEVRVGATTRQDVVEGLGPVFGLNRGAVDAVGVEAATRASRQFHELFAVLVRDGELDADVQRGDDGRVRELPDVEVVAGLDARQGFNVLLHLLRVDSRGRGLEEYLGRRLGQGDGGAEDDERDEEGHGRVGVEAVGRFC